MDILAHNKRNHRPRPAAEPTDAFPGSREKIAVMAARVEAGMEVFHPDDLSVAWELLDYSMVRTEPMGGPASTVGFGECFDVV